MEIKEIVGFVGFLTATALSGVLTAMIGLDAVRRIRARRRLLRALTLSGAITLVNSLYLAVFTITRVPEWRHTVDPLVSSLTLLFALSPVVIVLSLIAVTWILFTTYRASLFDGVFKHALITMTLGIPVLVGMTLFPSLCGVWDRVANPALRQSFAAAGVLAVALAYCGMWSVASPLVDRVRRRPGLARARQVLEAGVDAEHSGTDLLPVVAEAIAIHFNLPIATCLLDGEAARRLAADTEGACHVDTIRHEPLYQQLAEAGAEVAVIVGDVDDGIGLIGVRRGRSMLARDLGLLRTIGIEATRIVRRVRREESRRAEGLALETAARLSAEAKLSSLRAQINPHFLFNALNAIAGLIDENPAAAVSLVEDLSDLLRRVVSPGRDLVTLREELELVDAYVHIEQARLGHRLTYEKSIEVAADTQLVPVLSIQPLVENAVRHGAIPRTGPCQVTVSAVLRGAEVLIAVRDDGVGHAGSTPNGTGLANVSGRLAALYGPTHQVTFCSRVGEGTTVSFTVPRVVNERATGLQR